MVKGKCQGEPAQLIWWRTSLLAGECNQMLMHQRQKRRGRIGWLITNRNTRMQALEEISALTCKEQRSSEGWQLPQESCSQNWNSAFKGWLSIRDSNYTFHFLKPTLLRICCVFPASPLTPITIRCKLSKAFSRKGSHTKREVCKLRDN